MASVIPRRAGFVCHSCQRALQSKSGQRQYTSLVTQRCGQSTPPRSQKNRSFETKRFVSAGATAVRPRSQPQPPGPPPPASAAPAATAQTSDTPKPKISTLNPVEVLASLKKDVAHVTNAPLPPPQQYLVELVSYFTQFANILVYGVSNPPDVASQSEGENLQTSLLRDLSESGVEGGDAAATIHMSDSNMTAPFRKNAADTVAELLYTLIHDPKVFISQEILHGYVRVQCLLGKPEYLPEIFHLYAHKKIPVPDSSPVRYQEPWTGMPKYAVPLELAEAGLEAAILKKNLDLAIAVVDTTVATDAYRRNKVLTRASVPLAGVAAMPVLAYAAAAGVADWQNTMDPELAKFGIIAGGMAYIGTLSTIGYVAVTTTNDQMERVVWRTGTSLGRRWVREEERRFFDRLAVAWGFGKRERWGEETGAEWERLRDECGMRDMVLDKTDLMEGMQ